MRNVRTETRRAERRHRLTAATFMERLELRRGPRFVSRGGEKLQGALEDLGLSPAGAVCLDVGASTGGFTDCLLQNGAERVYAVLADGGEIFMKMEKTFFANRFAMLRDKFGTSWMLLHQPAST